MDYRTFSCSDTKGDQLSNYCISLASLLDKTFIWELSKDKDVLRPTTALPQVEQVLRGQALLVEATHSTYCLCATKTTHPIPTPSGTLIIWRTG